MGTNPLTLLLQHVTAFGFRAGAAFPQSGIAQHIPDRHPGRLQVAEKFDPGQDGCVIVTLARSVPVGIGKQPDPLIITDGMSRQSRTLRQFTDLHEHLLRHDAEEATRLSAL